jgi:hypothetical protein
MVGADMFLGLSTAGIVSRHGEVDGGQADHLRAGQPDAGNHAPKK